MSLVWRIAPQLSLSVRCWEEECALYVSPSGTTHILPRDLGTALISLQQAACSEDALAAEAGMPVALFAERLAALARLGVIEPITP